MSTAIGPMILDKDRIAPVLNFGPELASLNTNSMNFALGDWTKGKVLTEFIFENTIKTITTFAKTMKDVGTKAEIEMYDFGGMYNVLFPQRTGLLEEPLQFQFVFGVLDVYPSVSTTWLSCSSLSPRLRHGPCAVQRGTSPKPLQQRFFRGTHSRRFAG